MTDVEGTGKIYENEGEIEVKTTHPAVSVVASLVILLIVVSCLGLCGWFGWLGYMFITHPATP